MDQQTVQPRTFQQKHDSLRDTIAWLSCNRFTSQAALAQTLWPDRAKPAKIIAEYNTGRRNSKRLDPFELNRLERDIVFRLKRAELPLEVPSAVHRATEPAAPSTPASASTPGPTPPAHRRPSALMTLELKEVEGRHLGGQCLVMSIGTAAPKADDRWVVSSRGKQLQLRHGYRARYTFGAR